MFCKLLSNIKYLMKCCNKEVHLAFKPKKLNKMKKNQVTVFTLGLLFGMGLLIISGFTTGASNTLQTSGDVSKVSMDDATSYRQYYNNNFSTKPKGFNISIEQYKAIQQVVSEMGGTTSEISGFRLYHGCKENNSSSEKVSLVYTLDANRQEPIQGSSNNADGNITMANNVQEDFTDQCPPFCDM